MSGNNLGSTSQEDMGSRRVSEMTLRQHFAAMAMQGILSDLGAELNDVKDTESWDFEALSKISVRHADALLTELAATKGE